MFGCGITLAHQLKRRGIPLAEYRLIRHACLLGLVPPEIEELQLLFAAESLLQRRQIVNHAHLVLVPTESRIVSASPPFRYNPRLSHHRIPAMDDRQLLRYSRHILLDEIGTEGQQKLLDACVMVLGCGGLGSAALPYLAAAGVGRLMIADHDRIDETNLQRQTAYREADIGRLKTEAMAGYLKQLNPACQIETHGKLDEATLLRLLPQCQAALDCSDNFSSRQALNAAACATRTPLVSGAATRFDGQIATYRPDLPGQPCYACLFDREQDNDGTCALFGVFAPLVGIIGTTQAAEALKILLGLPAENGVLRCYNSLSGQWQHFAIPKNPACKVCSGHKKAEEAT